MKNVKGIGVLIVLASINFQFANSQNAEDIFKNKYPKLAGELKPEAGKDVPKEMIKPYRKEFQMLTVGLAEIDKFKHGGASEENLSFFEFKELKDLQKNNQFDKLIEIINKNQNDLKLLLSDKTKYGIDTIECLTNISMMMDFSKQKDWESAYKPWSLLFKYYPISSKNIYSKGRIIVLYKKKIVNKGALDANKVYKKTKDAKDLEKVKTLLKEQELWVDSLFCIYEKRLKYYGNDKKYGEGYILGQRGVDKLKYRKDSIESAYIDMKKSVELQKIKTSDLVVQSFFKASDAMFNKKKHDAAVVVGDFTTASDVLNQKIDYYKKSIEKKPKDTVKLNYAKQALDYVTQTFSDGAYAKCENLIPAFQPKFEENPKDVELLKRITSILAEKECTDSKLFENAAVALYDTLPSAVAAYNLAKLYLGKKDLENAAKYFEEAYTLTEDTSLKAKFYYKAALIAQVRGQKQKSRTLARKSLEFQPDNGGAYILIAKLYATSDCGENPFEKSWIYWVAVDKLKKAKSIDSSVSVEANKLINLYSAHFPTTENAFFVGVQEGHKITVGCWIQETTTARLQKK